MVERLPRVDECAAEWIVRRNALAFARKRIPAAVERLVEGGLAELLASIVLARLRGCTSGDGRTAPPAAWMRRVDAVVRAMESEFSRLVDGISPPAATRPPLVCACGDPFLSPHDLGVDEVAWECTQPPEFLRRLFALVLGEDSTVSSVFRKDGRSALGDALASLPPNTTLLVWRGEVERCVTPEGTAWSPWELLEDSRLEVVRVGCTNGLRSADLIRAANEVGERGGRPFVLRFIPAGFRLRGFVRRLSCFEHPDGLEWGVHAGLVSFGRSYNSMVGAVPSVSRLLGAGASFVSIETGVRSGFLLTGRAGALWTRRHLEAVRKLEDAAGKLVHAGDVLARLERVSHRRVEELRRAAGGERVVLPSGFHVLPHVCMSSSPQEGLLLKLEDAARLCRAAGVGRVVCLAGGEVSSRGVLEAGRRLRLVVVPPHADSKVRVAEVERRGEGRIRFVSEVPSEVVLAPAFVSEWAWRRIVTCARSAG